MKQFQSSIWDEVEGPNSRLSETARKDFCPKCKKITWAGYCRTGFHTQLRPQPILPAEDLLFYVTKRRTYKLWRVSGGFQFQLRTDNDLKRPSADIKLAVHRCDDAALTEWPDYWPASVKTFIPLNEEPPF